MGIRHLPKVLILTCAVVYLSASTKQEEKSLETSVTGTNGNYDGAPSDETVVTSPKDGEYTLSYADYEMTWRNFKLELNKRYSSSSEERRRFAIFMDNVKMIESHNMKYHLGQSTYWMDINEFSDWTQKEFEEWLGPLDVRSRSTQEAYGVHHAIKRETLPVAINWTEKGYVTPVKDQKNCGSCYAFSTTGSIEGQLKKKTNKLINLSEQQIVDCSAKFHNNGCSNGSVAGSYNYIKSVGGLQREADYPYINKTSTCRFDKSRVVAQIQGYKNVAPSEEALKSAVGTQGPVSVAVYAGRSFRNHRGGIYEDSDCENVKPNHAMLVVGYGRRDNTDYWIVKNCWGIEWRKQWNDYGYILMKRNTGKLGTCGIAQGALYPVVSDDHTSCPHGSNNNYLASCNNGSKKLKNDAITVLVTSTLVFTKFIQISCF